MNDPLVLYLADSIDARAGAELISERWPRADLVAVTPAELLSRLANRRYPLWVLGLKVEGLPNAIDPTPDASIAMQVWRQLHRRCRACNGTRTLYHLPGTKPVPGAECRSCSPPTWLRYLDDAVRGRLCGQLDDEDVAIWAALQSHASVEAQLGQLRRADESDGYWDGLVTEGAAILRARERWEDGCRSPEGCEFIARLRAERDGFKRQSEHLSVLHLDAVRECDALREGLREVLSNTRHRDEYGICCWCGKLPGHESDCRYAALCKLAGLDP